MSENNNVRQGLEAFKEKIQKNIKDRMSRPSVTQTLHEQNQKQAEKKSPLFADWKTDKATYVLMGISGVFTGMLGVILGLAPYSVTALDGAKSIRFNTDLIHWAIALLYAVAFITVTEAAFMIGKNKFHAREEGNGVQSVTMITMMVLAGISIVGTGYAGGVISASVLGFLSDFQEIPHSAQGWVVKVIPVLVAMYAFLMAAYKLSSEDEKSSRLTEQLTRQQRREHDLQRKLTELEVDEMMMLAEDKAYIEAVERGMLSAADAKAARKAGKTLGQLESERGQDLNGDGRIENTRSMPASTHQKPQDGHNNQPAPQHSLDEFLRVSGMSHDQARAKFADQQAFMGFASGKFDYISNGNMRRMYGELMNGHKVNP
jgi:hypothetical protein